MIKPSLDELLEKAENQYILVIETAKRARQLTEGASRLVDTDSVQNVTVALEEINAGKINYAIPGRNATDRKS